MTIQQMAALLSNPISIAIALIGALRLLLDIWVKGLNGLSRTAKAVECPRNRRFVKGIVLFITAKIEKLNEPPSLPVDAGIGQRVAYWINIGLFCVFIAWFTVYATCLVILAAIFLGQSKLIAGSLILGTAVVLFLIGKYFYRQAHGMRKIVEANNKLRRQKKRKVSNKD
jgi:hypothetical protein